MLYSDADVHISPGKISGTVQWRNSYCLIIPVPDRAYDELVAQNEKLRKEIEDLKALLVSKTHGQVQE